MVADTRIHLQPLAAFLYPDREVYVGWDQALQTYYARVTDGVDDAGQERTTLWVGAGLGEFTEPSMVLHAAGRYAEIPDDLADLLTIGRVSIRDTVTDLRPDSQSYQHEQELHEGLSRLYKPGGFATKITHDHVNPVLTEHGWTQTGVHAIDGGHAETYGREGQELTIPWGWPDRHHDTEQLLSPITLDGTTHGVSSPQDLANTLAEARTTTAGEGNSGPGLFEDLRDMNARGFMQDWQGTDEQTLTLDDLLREEPPDDDLGSSAGLGY